MPSYVGNMWSSLNELDDRGQMNIISDEVAIAEQIVAFLLTRKGEDPFNLDYGLDFNLFDNFNDFDADIWGFYVQAKIFENVAGIGGISVRSISDPGNGRVAIVINYSSDTSSSVHTLTFPYHLYTGAASGDAPIDEFVASISLNNDRFNGLR